MTKSVDTIVIGAGQAGLAAGYYLTQQKRSFVILEQASQVGQAWRSRWDSLQFITPTPYNNLPGLPFPKTATEFPTKADVIAYLEQYAQAFKLPIRFNQSVNRLTQNESGYRVETATTTFEAPSVIVAIGAYHTPQIPILAQSLTNDVWQIHSSQYQNPQSVPDGTVLVVGSGNSGIQIAKELSATHSVYLSTGSTPHLPRKVLNRDIFWWLHTLRITTAPIESRIGQRLSQRRDAAIGYSLKAIAKENQVKIVGRTQSANGNFMTMATGETITVNSVIWATGFRPDYSWLDAPVLDTQGCPIHQRGVTSSPGLYFLGLRWQSCLTSSLLGGVGTDAEFITAHLAQKLAALQIPEIQARAVSPYL